MMGHDDESLDKLKPLDQLGELQLLPGNVQHVDPVEETENPWSYLDDYVLTGDSGKIKAADRQRDDLLREVNWMVATGQVASLARLNAAAREYNRERDDEGDA